MSHSEGHFEGAKTFLTPFEMAHKVIVPQKKIMSRSFLNSGTLMVKNQDPGGRKTLCQLNKILSQCILFSDYVFLQAKNDLVEQHSFKSKSLAYSKYNLNMN